MAIRRKCYPISRSSIPLVAILLLAGGSHLGAQAPTSLGKPSASSISTDLLLKEGADRGFFSFTSPETEPLETLLAQCGKSPTLNDVIARVAKEFNLPPAAAQIMLRGFLLDENHSYARQPQPGNAWDEAGDQFDQALALAPSSRWVRMYAIRHYDSASDSPEIQNKISHLIRSAPSPAQTALDYANWVGLKAEADLASAAESSPSNPLLFLKASNGASGTDPARAAALAEWGFRILERTPSAPQGLVRLASATFITELINGGDTESAVSFWNGLPQDEKAGLLKKQSLPSDFSFDGCQVHLNAPNDFRLNLALAMFMVDGPVRGHHFLESLESPEVSDAEVTEHGSMAVVGEKAQLTLEHEAIEGFTRSSAGDPFDLVLRFVDPSFNSGSLPPSITWQKAVFDWASRERYETAIRQSGIANPERLNHPTSDPSNRQAVWPKGLGDSILDHQSRTTSAKAALRDQLKEKAPDPVQDRDTTTLRRLLEEPRQVPFTEHPLPAGIHPGSNGEEASALTRQILSRTGFPNYFEPVRAEMNGQEVVVIGTSQDLDPVGEVSPGGYWVARSQDGGKTWAPPRYTGLQVYRPYVMKFDSSLPMITGDHLRIEVSVKELDDQSITFPPLGLQVKRSVEGLFLDFPWSELEKDSDGDGLTDLMEEKLLTDPYNSDTDGDGLPDRYDPMPQVNNHASPDAKTAGAIVAILDATCAKDSQAILPGLASPGESTEAALRRAMGGGGKVSLSQRGATFICGPRDLFAGVMPRSRLVIVTEKEAEAVRKKFGVFYPIEFTNLFFDRAHERAFCAWSASWTGGSLLLTWKDGKWSVKVIGNWIT